MDNNKLGLKIVRINQGYTDLLEINGDQIWTKNVWDIRKDIENIDDLDGSSAVLMLTSIDTGHMLTVASLIGGRITDCISAWIHIPVTISISGKELVELVESVKKEILADERNDEKLRQLFSKTIELAPATKIASGSVGEKCAYRYYGQGAKYTLSELLKDMYQSYYKNYKSVFLLDNSSKLKCTQGDNLSDQKVYSMVVVKSPGKVDSFVPYVGDKPFEGQMYAVEGDVIKIEWRRNGFLPIQTETIVCQDLKNSVPSREQYMRVIPFDTIKVFDELGQSIREYEVYVEKKLIEHGRSIAISESTIENVLVEVYAEGFEPIHRKVNLTQIVKFKLATENYVYEFMLPLKNDDGYYSIKISGNRKLKNSPVKGYVTEDGNVTRNDKNYLRFNPFSRKYWIICLICSLIVLLLGVCGGYVLNDFIGDKADSNEVSNLIQKNAIPKSFIKDLENSNSNSSTQRATENNEDYSNEHAVSYLDTNNKWNRTEMEKFEILKGLWDALNKRDFEHILQYEEELKDSKFFVELVKAIKANERIFSGTYCDDGDTEITIRTYISKLGKVSPQSAPQNNKNNGIEKSEQNKW